MHSDFWAQVPYEQLPPDIKHEADECRYMETVYDARNRNRAALLAIGEAIYAGGSPTVPAPVQAAPGGDAETNWLLEEVHAELRDSIEALNSTRSGDGRLFYAWLAKEWGGQWRRLDQTNRRHQSDLDGRLRDKPESDKYKRRVALLAVDIPRAAELQARIDWAGNELCKY